MKCKPESSRNKRRILLKRNLDKTLLKGSLPPVEMLAGQTIKGQLVDEEGKAVVKAIVGFRSCNADLTAMWDSGPFPVDERGVFSLSIPSGGKAAAAILSHRICPTIS